MDNDAASLAGKLSSLNVNAPTFVPNINAAAFVPSYLRGAEPSVEPQTSVSTPPMDTAGWKVFTVNDKAITICQMLASSMCPL